MDKSATPKGRRRGRPPATELNVKQLIFVREYLNGATLKAAAKAAGYGEDHGTDLIKHPLVKAEIEKHREELREATKFGLEAAARQCDEDRTFARGLRNPNAMAACKATEHKMKLYGLIQDKLKVEHELPSIVDALAASRARALIRDAEIIDVPSQAILPAPADDIFGD
jgi:phage terminase small subunit